MDQDKYICSVSQFQLCFIFYISTLNKVTALSPSEGGTAEVKKNNTTLKYYDKSFLKYSLIYIFSK